MSTSNGAGRWVVFDLGETLVDETGNWGRWADFLGVPRLTFFGVMGAVLQQRRPHTDTFGYFTSDFDLQREAARKEAAGMPWKFDEDDLYDDALPTLQRLRADGFRLAVIANQPLQAVSFMASLPVDIAVASAEWAVHKPDPHFFHRVREQLAVPASDIAYVGDRVDNDIVPAKAAGMLAVHIRRGPWGLIQQSWPEAATADIQLDDLKGLPDALARMMFLPSTETH